MSDAPPLPEGEPVPEESNTEMKNEAGPEVPPTE